MKELFNTQVGIKEKSAFISSIDVACLSKDFYKQKSTAILVTYGIFIKMVMCLAQK